MTRHRDVYRDDIGNTGTRRETGPEYAPRQRARTDRDYFLWGWHCFVSLLQREAHRVRTGSHNEQNIGMPRRRCDKKPEPMKVIEGIIKLPDLVQTRAAVARVHDLYVNRIVKSAAEHILRFDRLGRIFHGHCPFVVGTPFQGVFCFALTPVAVHASVVVDGNVLDAGRDSFGRADRRKFVAARSEGAGVFWQPGSHSRRTVRLFRITSRYNSSL